LSDRVTKLELIHALGGDDTGNGGGGGGSGGTAAEILPPEGVKLPSGVTVAPISIAEPGEMAPKNAALTIQIEEFVVPDDAGTTNP